MRRKAVGAAVLLAASFASTAMQAPAHPPSIVSQSAEKVVADEIRAFRKALADAVTAKDETRLGAMYAPAFGHTDEAGRVDDRSARIKSALAGMPLIETAAVENLVIRIPNDWVAVARGTSTLAIGADGKRTVVNWTAVYTRADTSWWLVASHASRIPDNKP